MSDLPPPNAEQGASGEPAADPSADADVSRRWRTWQLALAAVVALVLGIGIGGSGEGTGGSEPVATDEPSPAPTVTVTETASETITETVTAEPEPAETVTVTATPQPQPDPDGGNDVITADQYEFTDIQVSEDFAGDFAARAQVTNIGDAVQGVIWKMSFVAGASVVGTADGTAREFGAGETITVEFTSTDDFTEHDEVRIQVDTEL